MQFFSKDALSFREQFNNLRKVQSICLCGLFVAAYVALSFFNLKLTPYLEFRFAFLALAAAAAYGDGYDGRYRRRCGQLFRCSADRSLFPGLYHKLRDSRFCVRPDSVSLQGNPGSCFRGCLL